MTNYSPMIEETERARDAALDSYQERLGNRTEGEEAAIRAAFRAGWSSAWLCRPVVDPDLERRLTTLAAHYVEFFTGELVKADASLAEIAHALFLLAEEARRQGEQWRVSSMPVAMGTPTAD